MVKLLEKVKIAIHESSQREEGDPSAATRVIDELERAKTRIALHGINYSEREIAFEKEAVPKPNKKRILKWLR